MAEIRFSDAEIAERLSQHLYLVLLHIGWPKMAYKMFDADVRVQNGNDTIDIPEEFRNNPRWSLMPKRWYTTLTLLESRARSIITKHDHRRAGPSATRGMALIPIAKAPEVFAALRGVRTEFTNEREKFCTSYADLLEELKSSLGRELWHCVKDRLPSPTAIRGKFHMTWAIFPFGQTILPVTKTQIDQLTEFVNRHMADEITDEKNRQIIATLDTLNHAASRRIAEIDDATAAELINEARSQMHEITRQMLEDIVRGPREEIAATIDDILEIQSRGTGVIRQSTLKKIQRALDTMKSFDFVADSELLRRIRDCEQYLTTNAHEEINQNATVSENFRKCIAALRDGALSEKGIQSTVNKFRRIVVTAPVETSV